MCNRFEIADFGREASSWRPLPRRLLRRGAHHIRALAEALGRTPPASRYSADMSKHAFFGADEAVPEAYREDYVRRL